MTKCQNLNDGSVTSWAAIIRRYKARHYPNHEAEMSWFRNQPTLHDAIFVAASAQDDRGKRYDHQRRLRRSALNASTSALLRVEQAIGKYRGRTFDELFALVEKTLGNILGAGELYLYDTALRIGSWLNLEPEKVYLHRGTRVGAMKLGVSGKRRFVEKSELPEPLRCLGAGEIEDILCIYADNFGDDKGASCG
jgi:hypothetical protein